MDTDPFSLSVGSQQCHSNAWSPEGRAELSVRLCQALCHITSLATDGGTLQSLEEFSSMTLFPYKPNSNAGEMVGLHQGRIPVCAKALGSHCPGRRKEHCVGLRTTSHLLTCQRDTAAQK